MCAIVGVYKKKPNTISTEYLLNLAQPLTHRSPDGHGTYIDDRIGLYHGRLAIHDLSSQGQQPFKTSNGVVSVTNGEIYNHQGLKHYLEKLHGQGGWQSESDCEVIPYLYQRYGKTFCEYLRGMFAIAVWDPRKQRLLLSRDPFGMKPLYYTETDEGFYFASECRALAQIILSQEWPEIDSQARVELLQYHFSLQRSTLLSKIKRVQPGETLIIEHASIVNSIYQPTPLGFSPQKPQHTNIENLLTGFERVMRESVKLHLSADVPLGLFLSGGIDSSILLTLAAQEHQQPLHTYSLGFDSHSTHDERAQAATLAKHFNTIHHEVLFNESDFWSLLPKAILATDDPTADYAIVPTFKLSMMAKRDVTVVLSGEGGDEIFAGYGRYRHPKKCYKKGDMNAFNVLRANLKNSRDAFNQLEQSCRYQQYSPLYTAQTVDMRSWLPNDLLIKLDRCTMWHGLEGRCPFLDKKVIQFANTLPEAMKIKGKLGKWLLRHWLQTKLPDYPALSPKKGFTVPIRHWLENRREQLAPALVDHPALTDICSETQLKKLFAKPLTRRTAKTVWSLLYYALWYQLHIIRVDHQGSIEKILSRREMPRMQRIMRMSSTPQLAIAG